MSRKERKSNFFITVAVLVGLSFIFVPVFITIAVPAYFRFQAKVKSSDAVKHLDKMRLGAQAFYQVDRKSRFGKPMPRHFPNQKSPLLIQADSTKNPIQSPCSLGHSEYKASVLRWKRQPWLGLKFSVSEAHSYQYVFAQEGMGKKAQFLVAAKGDLDCDGKFGVYMIRGNIHQRTGEVLVSPLKVVNPLE